MHNAVVFNLTKTKIGMKERILSAKIHVMIAAIGSQSPLPAYSHLVLYDRFNRKPVHKVQFQEGGARWVVLPAVSLVRRWVFSERLNQGVYFKLLGYSLDKSLSVRVITDPVDARDNRPLLIVETLPSKAELTKDIQSLIRWVVISKPLNSDLTRSNTCLSLRDGTQTGANDPWCPEFGFDLRIGLTLKWSKTTRVPAKSNLIG